MREILASLKRERKISERERKTDRQTETLVISFDYIAANVGLLNLLQLIFHNYLYFLVVIS